MREFLGWAMGMKAGCDETGTFHLLEVIDGTARPACNKKVYSVGGIEYPKTHPNHMMRCWACRSCVRSFRKTEK